MTNSIEPPVLRRARISIVAIFFLLGFVIANWVPRIPDIKQELGISNFALGLVLLGTPVGSLCVMSLAGRLCARHGSAIVTRVAGCALPLTLLPIAFVDSVWHLGAALALFGVFSGTLDSSMNAHAVQVERLYRRPLLSGIHAWFNVGGLVGAGAGSIATATRLDLGLHFAIAAAVGVVLAALAGRALLPNSIDSRAFARSVDEPNDGRSWTPSVVAIGLLGFVAFLGEGSVADWSAVFLREDLGASAG